MWIQSDISIKAWPEVAAGQRNDWARQVLAEASQQEYEHQPLGKPDTAQRRYFASSDVFQSRRLRFYNARYCRGSQHGPAK